jgi:hypothetical protein
VTAPPKFGEPTQCIENGVELRPVEIPDKERLNIKELVLSPG